MNTLRVDQQSINMHRMILNLSLVDLTKQHVSKEITGREFFKKLVIIGIGQTYLYKLERCL